jgi:hypothetical protein
VRRRLVVVEVQVEVALRHFVKAWAAAEEVQSQEALEAAEERLCLA